MGPLDPAQLRHALIPRLKDCRGWTKRAGGDTAIVIAGTDRGMRKLNCTEVRRNNEDVPF